MNNKGIRKLSIMSVIIFVAIVLTACFAMKFAVKTVARMITGSVDYASSIVKVTPDEVNIADLIVVDKNGVRVGDTRVDFSGIQSENTAGVTVEGGSDGAIADVTESGFSQTRYTFSADINRSLDIDVTACDIVIAGTDTDSVIVDVLENDTYKYKMSTSDNTLVIRDGEAATESETLNLFGLKIPTGKKRAPSYTGLAMIIYLPESFGGKITAISTDGDVKLGNLKLEEELTVTTANGTMTLSDIEAYDITLTNATGRLSLTNLSATEITAETTDAKIRAEDLTAKRLTLTTTNAPIDFSRLFGEKFDLGTTNADISGSILGDELLFSISTETDQTAYPKSKENERSKYKLNAKTNGGDIDINFVS